MPYSNQNKFWIRDVPNQKPVGTSVWFGIKRNHLIFLLAFVTLFLQGCISSTTLSDFSDGIGEIDFEYSPEVKQISDACTCLVCKPKDEPDGFFEKLLSVFTNERGNLDGSSCYFDTDCTETIRAIQEDIFEKASEGEDVSAADYKDTNIQPFMLGMGPRVWDFTYANQYCQNSLQFVVHWITPKEIIETETDIEFSYDLPPSTQSSCFLENNVMPVYMLYSNGSAIGVNVAQTLASGVSGKGPVILVSEVDFDSKKPGVVEKVQDQILALREGCPRPPGFVFGENTNQPYCLVAVAPKLNDKEGLDAVLENEAVADAIDLIAIGVNSRNLMSDTCTSANLFDEAVEFSKYAWFEKGKPVIWPYMLFDSKSKNSPDAERECFWERSQVNEAYYDFFATALPSASAAGVIGAAPYQFYSAGFPTDPLDCTDCGLVEINSNGELAPNKPLFSSWFYGCQRYIPKGNAILTTFAEEELGTCNAGFQAGLGFDQKFTTGSASGFYNANFEPEPALISCMECLSPMSCTADEDGEITCEHEDENPFNIPTIGVGDKCDYFPELDVWGSIRGVDPALMRAIAWVESGLNTDNPKNSYCATGENTGTLGGAGCVNFKLDEIVDLETDPELNCGGIQNSGLSATPPVCSHDFGLMQINNYYPSEYWVDGSASSTGVTVRNPVTGQEKAITARNYDVAAACAPEGEFNPYNGAQNACVGSWIFERNYKKSQNWVNANADKLAADTQTKKNWLTAFVAFYDYAGRFDVIQDSLIKFESRKTISCSSGDTSPGCFEGGKTENACNGNTDNFIAFVTCCTDFVVGADGDYVNYCKRGSNSQSWCSGDSSCADVYPLEDLDDDVFAKAVIAGGTYTTTGRQTGYKKILRYNSLINSCEDKYLSCSNPEEWQDKFEDFAENFEREPDVLENP